VAVWSDDSRVFHLQRVLFGKKSEDRSKKLVLAVVAHHDIERPGIEVSDDGKRAKRSAVENISTRTSGEKYRRDIRRKHEVAG